MLLAGIDVAFPTISVPAADPAVKPLYKENVAALEVLLTIVICLISIKVAVFIPVNPTPPVNVGGFIKLAATLDIATGPKLITLFAAISTPYINNSDTIYW
jgi:hypothetical protein